jgi:hypothetical protein
VASNAAARFPRSSAPLSRRRLAAACRFLSPHQTAVLQAAADQLFPGTRVVSHLNQLLSRFNAQTSARRMRVADLRDQYTDGIALLDQLAGGDFTAVSRLQQDLIMSHAQAGSFVSLLLSHIVEALYAPPFADRYHDTG